MRERLQSVRGMHDVLPSNWQKKQHILSAFKDVCTSYSFEGMETPCVEPQSLFVRTVQTSDIVTKEMFQLKRRDHAEENAKKASSSHNNCHVLRPEGTAPVMRSILQHGLAQKMPLRVFYEGPMFRYDRPQKGRLRQFHQIGIESLGQENIWADVEVLQMAWTLLQTLGIEAHVTLQLNTLGDVESRQSYTKALQAFLTPHKDQLSPESQQRLTQNPLRIWDSKSTADQDLLQNVPPITKFLTVDAGRRFEKLQKALSTQHIPFVCNPSIVRGLDYYTQTTFEIVTDKLGAQSTVLAGGRYDGLSETLGGPALPGIGWASGLERLMLLQEAVCATKSTADCKAALLPFDDDDTPTALLWADQWRKQGVHVLTLTQPGALAKRLKKAVSLGCTHTLIIGNQEREAQNVVVKNLECGTQETLPYQQVPRALQTPHAHNPAS